MKKIIAASILGKENKKDLINNLIDNGIQWIHYDIMDGDFVSNHSLPIEETKDLLQNTKEHYKDIHLMVQNPSSYIDELIDYSDQFSIHFESKMKDSLENTINKYCERTKMGLVVNPSTPIEGVFPYLEKLNHVMIMSVVPGQGGQTFIENSINKIEDLKKRIEEKNLNVLIEIDGGINNIWGPKVFSKGVDVAVSGSYLINNLKDNAIEKLTTE